MKWMKRGLWTAAWGCWVWLGFGLYRELPRDLGPVVCELPLDEDERDVGFLSGTDLFLSLAKDSESHATTLRYRNAKSGELVKQAPGPRWPLPYPSWSLDAGFMFGQNPARPDQWGFLNLFTGNWSAANLKTKINPTYHPWRPLTLVQTYSKGIGDVTVLDSEGRSVFQRRLTSEQVEKGAAAFFIGENRIGLCFAPTPWSSQYVVEVWSLASPDRPPRVITGLHIDESAMTARNGRVAWRGELGPRVFDFNTEQLLFDLPSNQNWPNGWSPLLSPNGRKALDANRGNLWDVESGKCIWNAGENKKIHWEARAQHLEAFEVWEDWKFEVGDWSEEFFTLAVRDLNTGRLRFRCWEPVCMRDTISSDGSLYWRYYNVHVLPPPVNYPLLALCQTILALPLVLLWAALRWRRKRRMKLASAAA